MKKITINNIIVLIVILLMTIVYFDIRKTKFFIKDHIISKDTVIINLPQQIINIPPSKPIKIIEKVIPSIIDTGSILKAYFKEVYYNDSIENDTLKLSISEIVSENSIRSRELKWKLKLPIQTIVDYHQESKRKLLIGTSLIFQNEVQIIPTIAYKNRKDQFITIGFNPIKNEVNFGGYFPLKKN